MTQQPPTTNASADVVDAERTFPRAGAQMTYAKPSTNLVQVAAVPLSTLSSNPAPVSCPVCEHVAMTKVDYESGAITWRVPKRPHYLAMVLLIGNIGCGQPAGASSARFR